MPTALAIRAVLAGDAPVVRTIAIREDQTLEQLHEALRLAFGWWEAHLYAFWSDGKFWSDAPGVRYPAPFELDEGEQSARTPLSDLRLRRGAKLAYVFDFGDEWRLLLKVTDSWEAEDECYPMLVEAEGAPPPQYEPNDDESV